MALVDVWNVGSSEVQYAVGLRIPAGGCLKGKEYNNLPAGLKLLIEDPKGCLKAVPQGQPAPKSNSKIGV